MGQPLAKETSTAGIMETVRRRKWPLLVGGVFILAGTLAFVLLNTKSDAALGLVIPKKIVFSFGGNDGFELAAKSLSKNEFERIALFLLNRDLFRQYVRETSGSGAPAGSGSAEPQAFIIPKYSVDFSSGSVRNEMLQYLLFRSPANSGLSVERVGDFILNVFKNYYLLEIFREYHEHLQSEYIKFLDSQRVIEDNLEKAADKVAQLREQKRKHPLAFPGRGNLLLQVNGDNERYLDLEQQIAANDILLGDTRNALEMNLKRIARTRFLIDFVAGLRREFLEAFFVAPDRAERRLLEVDKEFAGRGLGQEFQKLKTFFDLVNGSFRFYPGDPAMLRDRFVLVKALAILIVGFGLLLLTVLMLERRENAGL